MRWRHVFVPLLPAALASYVEAPTPYVMGLHANVELAPEALRGVVVVDLDANDVRGCPDSDWPPRDVADPLATFLRRHERAPWGKAGARADPMGLDLRDVERKIRDAGEGDAEEYPFANPGY